MSSAEILLRRRIHASARYLDDHNFDAFLSLFLEEADYEIVAQAPELRGQMTWMQRSKTELAERFAAVPKHEWQIMQAEQTRLVSVDVIDIENDCARSSSSFVVFNTDSEGRSSCFVVGRYEDEWRKDEEEWYLQKRQVLLKTRLLTTLSPLPI
jgi:3-phenylpropionate/cinnamic acid dioxygenase small subunit